MQVWKQKAFLNETTQEERAVSCSTWVLGIQSSVWKSFLWPMGSAERVAGRAPFGRFAEISSFHAKYFCCWPSKGCTGKKRRGWRREFITRLCFLLWVWWAAALPPFVSLNRLTFCILVRAEVDAWWMVDYVSACSLSQSIPRLKIPAPSVCQAGPSCPALTVVPSCQSLCSACTLFSQDVEGLRKA